jgi:hypothetical protein
MTLDLDAIERHVFQTEDYPCDDCKPREMLAELRATREVVEAARVLYEAYGGDIVDSRADDLAHALNRYEDLTTEARP